MKREFNVGYNNGNEYVIFEVASGWNCFYKLKGKFGFQTRRVKPETSGLRVGKNSLNSG